MKLALGAVPPIPEHHICCVMVAMYQPMEEEEELHHVSYASKLPVASHGNQQTACETASAKATCRSVQKPELLRHLIFMLHVLTYLGWCS